MYSLLKLQRLQTQPEHLHKEPSYSATNLKFNC